MPHRKNRKELNRGAALAEDTVAGGLLDLAPLAEASAADICAALASKGLRVEQVRSQRHVTPPASPGQDEESRVFVMPACFRAPLESRGTGVSCRQPACCRELLAVPAKQVAHKLLSGV